MRVLVTGGTGFVGRAVVPALREADHETTLLARQPGRQSVQALARPHAVAVVGGDVLDRKP